ncbi:PDZ domain-containing protein, partial [Paenibacillus sp. MCAF20]
MKSYIPNRVIFLLFLLVLITILSYLTIIIVREPFIGAEVVKNDDGQFVVKLVEPAGQAVFKGIRAGDLIMEVNGDPAGQYKNVIKFNSIEMADTVIVKHLDGNVQRMTFTGGWTGDHSNWELLIQLYIPLISFLLFSALSIFLYMKRRNDGAALMLILFFVVIGLSYYS